MGKIKAVALELVKRNVIMRRAVRRIIYCKRLLQYLLIKLSNKTDEKMICFKAFGGRSYSCTPKAIYEYMLTQDKYKDYTFVWSFEHPEDYKFLEKNHNTVVIHGTGREYNKYMATAKYWIHNFRVADHIYPKSDQIYVQCWHGTPLKRLGYDIENSDNALNSIDEIRFKYKVDADKFRFLLSPSKFASERFASAWNLKAVGKENTILEQGYPRNDRLINHSELDAVSIKAKLGIPSNKRVILYAPTWRDNQHDSNIGYTYKAEVDFDYLRQELGEDYVILFRAHYIVANSFDFEKYGRFVYDVSNYDDINDLYIAADLLITDYSSVFFDYANLRKPMLFYMYDFDAYKNEMRDFYIDIDELPGPIIVKKDEKQLVDTIRELENFDSYIQEYGERYVTFHNKFNPLDDGNASKRVIEEILKA